MRFVANGYPEDRIVAYDHDGAGLEIEAYAAGLDRGHRRHPRRVRRRAGLPDRPLPRDRRLQPLPQRPGAGRERRQVRRHRRPPLPRTGRRPVPRPDPGAVPRPDARRGRHLEGVLRRAVRVPRRRGARGRRHRPAERPRRDRGPGGQLPRQHRPRGHPRHLGHRPRHRRPHRRRAARQRRARPRRRVRPDRARERRALRVRAEQRLVGDRPPPLPAALRAQQPLRPACSPPSPTARCAPTPTSATTTARSSSPACASGTARATPTSSSSASTAASPSTSSPTSWATARIGLHVHDDVATPGETTLAPLPYFSEQPFQSGIDVYLPASPDADGTITATNLPRGDAGRPQTLNVPNWPSAGTRSASSSPTGRSTAPPDARTRTGPSPSSGRGRSREGAQDTWRRRVITVPASRATPTHAARITTDCTCWSPCASSRIALPGSIVSARAGFVVCRMGSTPRLSR